MRTDQWWIKGGAGPKTWEEPTTLHLEVEHHGWCEVFADQEALMQAIKLGHLPHTGFVVTFVLSDGSTTARMIPDFSHFMNICHA